MAITQGTPVRQTVNPGIPGNSSLNFTFTSDPGASHVVFCFTAQSDSNAITVADLTATYDGVDCDIAVQGRDAIDRDFPNTLWVTVAPQAGTAVVLSTSAGLLQNGSMWAVDVFGSDVANPIGSVVAFDNDNDDDLVGEFALSTDVDGAVVFGSVAVQGTDAGPFTPSTGFTEQVDDTFGNGNSNGTAHLIETAEIATAGAVPVDASWGAIDGLTYAYFSLNPAVGGGDPDVNIATANRSGAAQALGLARDIPLTSVLRSTTAQALSVSVAADVNIATASRAAGAQSLAIERSTGIVTASRSSAAQGIEIIRDVLLGTAARTATAQVVTAEAAGAVVIGTATRSATSQTIGLDRDVSVAAASRSAAAQALATETGVTIGTAARSSTGQGLALDRAVDLQTAARAASAQSVTAEEAGVVTLGTASRSASAQGLAVAADVPIGTAARSATVPPLSPVRLVDLPTAGRAATAQSVTTEGDSEVVLQTITRQATAQPLSLAANSFEISTASRVSTGSSLFIVGSFAGGEIDLNPSLSSLRTDTEIGTSYDIDPDDREALKNGRRGVLSNKS